MLLAVAYDAFGNAVIEFRHYCFLFILVITWLIFDC